VSLDHEVDLDLSSGSVLTQFLSLLAPSVGVEVAEVLRCSFEVCSTSFPQESNSACFDLARKLGTGNVAGISKVQTLAKALASQSVAFCCNNPYCCSIKGWSELQLPQHGGRTGKGVCGGCRAACYCSKSCQKEAWPLHRLACTRPIKPGV
jgi:hypothetical protein